MASKTSRTDQENWPGPRITFEDFATRLAARRAELGDSIDMPRNSGLRRTGSKIALLQAVKDAGGQW